MRVTGYAYPWDVDDDPGFVRRTRELGVDEVAVAIAYHGARAATPWQANRASVLAEHAALYRPVREDTWRFHALRRNPRAGPGLPTARARRSAPSRRPACAARPGWC